MQIGVTDRHPERGLLLLRSPSDDAVSEHFADAEGEGGRGLLMCSALSSRWGVEYTAGQKTVWFRLPLQRSSPGTRYALPQAPGEVLPSTDGPVLVAVVQVDGDGIVRLLERRRRGPLPAPGPTRCSARPGRSGWSGRRARRERRAGSPTRCDWPAGRAPSRCAGPTNGPSRSTAPQVRVLDATGTPSTLCLMVRERRAAPSCAPQPRPGRLRRRRRPSAAGPADDFEVVIGRRRPGRPAAAHRRAHPRPARRRRRLPAADHRGRERVRGPRLHRTARRPPALRQIPVEAGTDATTRPGCRPSTRTWTSDRAPSHCCRHRTALADHRAAQGRGPADRLAGRRLRAGPTTTTTTRRCACSSPPTGSR